MDAQERAAFLFWRRGLAALEEAEHLVLTPFEKNLEVWRQLWRVLERSHIVVQVPLLTPLHPILQLRPLCTGILARSVSKVVLGKCMALPSAYAPRLRAACQQLIRDADRYRVQTNST